MATDASPTGTAAAGPSNGGRSAAPVAPLQAALKLVIWDLDETLWKGTLSEGEVALDPLAGEIVRTLNRRGIVSSICSKNDPDRARERLTAEQLWDEFVFPSISWTPKGPRIAQIVEDLQLRPVNVLFIDDNFSNLQEALHFVPELQIAEPDILSELLAQPQAKGKDDSGLTRLAQYKVLERKAADRRIASAGNEEFLRSCDIRVQLEDDCAEQAPRLLDLVNRSNQLNFTKSRITPEQLEQMLADSDRETRFVRAHDRYGDYGICGFYSLKDGHLTDFVFSCRILHMGIEQWVYERLGRPQLDGGGRGDLVAREQRGGGLDHGGRARRGGPRAGPAGEGLRLAGAPEGRLRPMAAARLPRRLDQDRVHLYLGDRGAGPLGPH